MKTPSKLKVIELFAGVGGFRLGLEGLGSKHLSSTSGYKKPLENKICIPRQIPNIVEFFLTCFKNIFNF